MSAFTSRRMSVSRQASLLESYIKHLHASEAAGSSDKSKLPDLDSYAIPSEILSAEEWQNFINVYQVHSPVICIDNVTRDVRSLFVLQSLANSSSSS